MRKYLVEITIDTDDDVQAQSVVDDIVDHGWNSFDVYNHGIENDDDVTIEIMQYIEGHA